MLTRVYYINLTFMSFKVSHQAEIIQQEHSDPDPKRTRESTGHTYRTRKGTRKRNRKSSSQCISKAFSK